jgi:hypothetical protein
MSFLSLHYQAGSFPSNRGRALSPTHNHLILNAMSP